MAWTTFQTPFSRNPRRAPCGGQHLYESLCKYVGTGQRGYSAGTEGDGGIARTESEQGARYECDDYVFGAQLERNKGLQILRMCLSRFC